MQFEYSSDDSETEIRSKPQKQITPNYSIYKRHDETAIHQVWYPHAITLSIETYRHEEQFAIIMSDYAERDAISPDFSASCDAAPPITFKQLRLVARDMFPLPLTKLAISAKNAKDDKWYRASICIDSPAKHLKDIDQFFAAFGESVPLKILFDDLGSKQDVLIQNVKLLDQRFSSKMRYLIQPCKGVIGLKELSLDPQLVKSVLLFGKASRKENPTDIPRRWKKVFFKCGSLIECDEIIDLAKCFTLNQLSQQLSQASISQRTTLIVTENNLAELELRGMSNIQSQRSQQYNNETRSRSEDKLIASQPRCSSPIFALDSSGPPSVTPKTSYKEKRTDSSQQSKASSSSAKPIDKKYKCEHDGCGEAFRQKKDLIAHGYKHTGQRPFKCDHVGCDATFIRKADLTKHSRIHTNTFKVKDALTKQGKSLTGEKRFKCEHKGCIEAFRYKKDLISHGYKHTGQRPYKCDYKECDKAFTRKDTLTAHKRTHTGEKPFKCEHKGCKEAFKNKRDLTIHERNHTGERPFKCEDCDAAYTGRDALIAHKRTHTGEKPYKCKYEKCKSEFPTQNRLTSHERIHTGEKPYECSYDACGEAFAHTAGLTRHVKLHTKRPNPPMPTADLPEINLDARFLLHDDNFGNNDDDSDDESEDDEEYENNQRNEKIKKKQVDKIVGHYVIIFSVEVLQVEAPGYKRFDIIKIGQSTRYIYYNLYLLNYWKKDIKFFIFCFSC